METLKSKNLYFDTKLFSWQLPFFGRKGIIHLTQNQTIFEKTHFQSKKIWYVSEENK